MHSRPAIPIEIKREVIFDARHHCAVCCTPLPLEYAHIVPWREAHEHSVSNLIALCANCHSRADKERWGEKYLRRYKQKPCALESNILPPLSPAQKMLVDMIVDTDPDMMQEHERQRLVSMLAAYLNVSLAHVEFISTTPANSSRIRISLPRDAAEKLILGFNSGDPLLKRFLEDIKLLAVELVDVEPIISLEHEVSQKVTGGQLAQLDRLIKRYMKELKVDIVTIHTPDPWTLGEYRLFWMDGVRDKAPMYGRERPTEMKSRILGNGDGRTEWYISDLKDDDTFKNSPFTEREETKSLARFHLLTELPYPEENPGAIVCMSYRKVQTFNHDYMARLKIAVSAIEETLRPMRETQFSDPKALAQHAIWLAQIAQVTRDAMTAGSVDNVIEHILKCALAVTDIDEGGYCSIHLIQPGGKIRADYHMLDGKLQKRPESDIDIATGEGITTKVARERRSLLLNDIKEVCEKWPVRYTYIAPADNPRRSELAVPIYTAKDRVIGVLNIESPTKGAFKREHVRVIEALADTAAIAIAKSKFAERLNRIVTATAEINPANGLENVMEAIKSQATRQLDANDADLWLYKGGTFENPLDHNPSHQPRSKKQNKEVGISEWLLIDGQQRSPQVEAILVTDMNHDTHTCELKIVVNDDDVLTVDPAPVHKTLNPGMDNMIKSEVGLPLIYMKKNLGVLWIKWRNDHEFIDEELPLLHTFAAQVSLAIHFANVLKDPFNEAYERIMANVFGPVRAGALAANRAELKPKFDTGVTVMFADVRSSSQLLSVLQRSDEGKLLFQTIIDDFLKLSTDVVHKHGGALATFLGDGVMAVFGAPKVEGENLTASEYAINAAHAALDLADCLKKELPTWTQEIFHKARGPRVPKDFGFGLGLHSDQAVVGNFSVTDEGFDFTAVGQAPHIASRVENRARARELWPDDPEKDRLWPFDTPPGNVIVLCTTYMQQYFNSDPGLVVTPLREEVELKGIAGYFQLGVLERKEIEATK